MTAVQRGCGAIGYDRNPAMVVLARALHTPIARPGQLTRRLDDVLAGARRVTTKGNPTDPLMRWFDSSTVGLIRCTASLVSANRPLPFLARELATLPYTQAILYLTLFRVVRVLLRPFRTSNPTWIRRSRHPDELLRITPAAFRDMLREQLQETVALLPYHRPPPLPISLEVADARSLPLHNGSIDAVIASPPYCTRIDYAIATLPELALLGCDTEEHLKGFRIALMGSTVTPATTAFPHARWGATCGKLLRAVAQHRSKASAAYYLRYLSNYFAALSSSLAEIARVLRPHSRAVLVLQDSFYKELHIDLQQVAIEMLASSGVSIDDRIDFSVPAPLASIQPHRHLYRNRVAATESALIVLKRGSRA